MNRREQRVFRAWGRSHDWMLIDLLIDPGSDKRVGGSSHFDAYGEFPERTSMSYDSKGIHINEHRHADSAYERCSFPWSLLARHAVSLPADLLGRLADHRSRMRQSQRDYPVFAAPAAAQGCGRLRGLGPYTEAQALFAEALDRYDLDRLRPWRAAREAIDAERVLLLDEAFPLVHDNQCDDLFELLAESS